MNNGLDFSYDITRAITAEDIAQLCHSEQVWSLRPGWLIYIYEMLPSLIGMKPEQARLALGILPVQGGVRKQPEAFTAILPIFGVIWPRGGLSNALGLLTPERITAIFRNLVEQSNVKTIVLDIDSPGGTVLGVDELSSEIFKARKKKRVVAISNFQAVSAAYWIASSAEEIIASPSSETGGIGVYVVHEDNSKALENEGVKITLVSEGRYKTEGNPFESLSDEARASIQLRVREYYGMFTRRVALGRGVSSIDVRYGFGEGRALGANTALQKRLVDGIGTLDTVVKSIGSGKQASDRSRQGSLSGDFEFRRRRARFQAAILVNSDRENLLRAEVNLNEVRVGVVQRAFGALAYCTDYLHLGRIELRWFDASHDFHTNGFYSPAISNEIWLSTNVGLDKIAGTVAHECRHAWQFMTQPNYRLGADGTWREWDALSFVKEFEITTQAYTYPNGQVVYQFKP